MDAAEVTELFALLDRELWLITAAAGPRRGGLIATFVSQASIVPDLPRMLFGLARHHHTWELIEASNACALHLIDEDHLDWVWRFGSRSGRDDDKLAGLPFCSGITGSPLLNDALGWLECRIEARLDTGDRTVYLAEVVEGRLTRAAAPLTFKRMLQRAPTDRLEELKQQMVHDIPLDAAAIRAWRQQRQGKSSLTTNP